MTDDHSQSQAQGVLGALLAPLRVPQRVATDIETIASSIERIVTELQNLGEAVTTRMDAIHNDLNARMLTVEQEIHAMRPQIEQMSRDLASVVELLPEPNAGPMSRLKDTLTSS